jgi:hypothetical protein
MYALPMRTVPASRTVCSQPIAVFPSEATPTAGTPAITQISTPINGRASSVGIFFVIMRAAMIKNTIIIDTP